MKQLITIVWVLCTSIVIAQNVEKREIDSFDKIEVTGNIKVEMKFGDKEALELRALYIDPVDIITEVEDKLLKIKVKSGLFDDNVDVKIKLTYKEIREITSNASAEIIVNELIKGDKLFAEATSGGRILMKVDINAIELKAYQGANIDVSGKCKIQESFINTGGVLSASNFECDEVFIKMNTGGNAEVVANKKIEARVNTKATLSFFGRPAEESLKTTLGGHITKWDED